MLKIAIFDCRSKRVNSGTMHSLFIVQRGLIQARCIVLSIKFAINLGKKHVNIAMATVLLRHPIFIKCWSYHRKKAPWQLNKYSLYLRHLCRGVYSFHLSIRMFIRSFVCLFICSFVCSFIRGIISKFYIQATGVEYISPTTHQKAFIFGP